MSFPASPTNNQTYVSSSGTTYIYTNGAWNVQAGSGSGSISTGRTITASVTAALADANTLITANHATTPIVITIPNDATVGFQLLTYIPVYQQGAAAVSFAAGSGVNPLQGTSPAVGAGAISGLLKVSANTWAYA